MLRKDIDWDAISGYAAELRDIKESKLMRENLIDYLEDEIIRRIKILMGI